MSTKVCIQKEKNLSPERDLSQISHLIYKAPLTWTEFRAGGQNILPSKRLKFSRCITITHLSFCEASENHWKVFHGFFWCGGGGGGVLFNEQINLPSEQICIPFGNV